MNETIIRRVEAARAALTPSSNILPTDDTIIEFSISKRVSSNLDSGNPGPGYGPENSPLCIFTNCPAKPGGETTASAPGWAWNNGEAELLMRHWPRDFDFAKDTMDTHE
jgi:hypothetical protein